MDPDLYSGTGTDADTFAASISADRGDLLWRFGGWRVENEALLPSQIPGMMVW